MLVCRLLRDATQELTRERTPASGAHPAGRILALRALWGQTRKGEAGAAASRARPALMG